MKGFLFALHVLFSLCVARSFKVWAPHASSVLVVSKNWSVELGKTFDGTFLGATSEAQIGDLYQFLIDGALRRVDPTSQEREGEFSIIHNSSFVWKSKSNLTVPSRLVVYELHIPSFSEEGTFDGAAKKLPFLKSLGVNMVELMPVSDFFGPSNGWGYNPTGLLRCVMKKFGGALGLKRFVDEAHLLGIGVALDVVFNHFDPGNLLLDFDSNSSQYGNGIFFYNQQGYSMTYWGPRPNFGSKHIVSFLLETLQTFVSEFRIDGFRFDSTVCIRKPGQSCWTNPQNNSEGIAFLQSCNQLLSNFFTTAEDDQGQSIVVRPIAQGGLGFKTQWGYKGFYYTFESLLTYSDNNSINVSLISNLIESSIEGPRVLFTENHDMASNQNKGRIPKIVDPNGSGENPSYWAAKKAMMGISVLAVSNGVPMLFQGQEMLTYDSFLFPVPPSLNWNLAVVNSGIVREVSDLFALPISPFQTKSEIIVGQIVVVRNGDLLCCLNFASEETNVTLSGLSVSHGNLQQIFNGDSRQYFPQFRGLGASTFEIVNGTGVLSSIGEFAMICFK